MKIIHVFNDDKFIDPAIKILETTYPEISEYYIIKNDNEDFKYIKSNLVKRLNFKNKHSLNIFLKKLNSNSEQFLFLHALDKEKQEIVLLTSKKIRKVWFIWGYDLYNNWGSLNKKIYEPQTKKIIKRKRHLKKKIIFNSTSFFLFRNLKIIHKILPKIIIKALNNNYNTKFYRAVQMIDVVVPIVPNEYSLVQDINPKLLLGTFAYGCIEDLFGNKINEKLNGQRNILVGNSADPTNNHMEVFLKLSKLNLENRKIYVPLSYSGNDKYIKEIVAAGIKLFGNKFQPLLNFMPLNKYNEIILSCGTLIFNHVRQQGVGNIVTMAYFGAKIYLNNKSPVYKYYRKKNLVLGCIKDIKQISLDQPNSIEEIIKNKKILFSLYSRTMVHEKINNLIYLVKNIQK